MRSDVPVGWLSAGPVQRRPLDPALEPALLAALAAQPGDTVLELGCGDGAVAAGLQRCGWDVLATDADPARLEAVRIEHPALTLRALDLQQPLAPELAGRFDAVIALDLVDRVAQPQRLAQVAMAALRPGGLLLVAAPNHGYARNLWLALADRLDTARDPLRNGGRLRLFSCRSLAEVLRAAPLAQCEVRALARVPMFARTLLAKAHAPR
jgi:2-polyprenyl-6-hydroxyphenyl methylase/3-demethylubiquinone-9 3-methyltransferase